VSWHCGL
jgi:hypothetical protein